MEYLKIKNESKLHRFALVFFIVIMAAAALFFIICERNLPHEAGWDDCYLEEFQDGWYQVLPDGCREPIQPPVRIEADEKNMVTIEKKLPDESFDYGQYLIIKASMSETYVYVDDEMIYEYCTKDSRLFGTDTFSATLFVKLEPEYANKTVRITMQSTKAFAGNVSTFYYGDKFSFWKMFIRKYWLVTTIGLFLLTFSIIAVLTSVGFGIAYGERLDIEYLSWALFAASIWMLTQSRLTQLIFPNLSIAGIIPDIAIELFPITFLIYVCKVQKNRYKKYYDVMIILFMILLVTAFLLQCLNLVQYTQSAYANFVLLAIAIGLMVTTLVLDILNGKIKEYSVIAIGFAGLAAFGIVQILAYFNTSVPYVGTFFGPGLIFLFVMAAINTGQEIQKTKYEKDQAVAASAAKAEFLANMSHEIRTPINAILGMNEMIMRETKEENIREYSIDVNNAGRNLLGLVNDILDFSKIESGKLEIVPVDYDLNTLIRTCCNLVATRAYDKGLKFHVTNDADLPVRLNGDEKRVSQVIMNLLTNAVKYTRFGEVSFDIRGNRNGDTIELIFAVKDTGIGVAKEDIEKLFERFQRLDLGKNRNIEGTGLGLAITKRIADAMNGTITVESEYNQGSTFTFYVTQRIIEDTPMGEFILNDHSKGMIEKLRPFLAPEASILVVDDVNVNLKIFYSFIKNTKIHLKAVLRGKDCLEAVRQEHYDIIFLDHMMPEMDGIDVIRKIKSYHDFPNEDTPIIMLTANAISGAEDSYLSEGFSAYLTKPFKQQELLDCIRAFLPEGMIIDVEEW